MIRQIAFCGALSLASEVFALTKSEPKLGTFHAATESGLSLSFELKKGGVLEVTPSYWNEDEGTGDKPKPPKAIRGQWKKTKDGIELRYAKFEERMKFQSPCKDWQEYPCFRFEKSLVPVRGKEKSPLAVEYPFINWNWKL